VGLSDARPPDDPGVKFEPLSSRPVPSANLQPAAAIMAGRGISLPLDVTPEGTGRQNELRTADGQLVTATVYRLPHQQSAEQAWPARSTLENVPKTGGRLQRNGPPRARTKKVPVDRRMWFSGVCARRERHVAAAAACSSSILVLRFTVRFCSLS
jgi:hypothetical protein